MSLHPMKGKTEDRHSRTVGAQMFGRSGMGTGFCKRHPTEGIYDFGTTPVHEQVRNLFPRFGCRRQAALVLLLALLSWFAESGIAAPISLELVPAVEYSDPYGVTFLLTVSDGDWLAALKPEDVTAYWLPKNFIFKDGRPESQKQLDAHRTGAFLLTVSDALFLHVRRVPNHPAKPDSLLGVRLARKGEAPIWIRPELPDSFQKKEVDVVLLIDESLSMKRNDPERLRVAAARVFIDLAASGERIRRIGVVAFNHQSRRILPLTAVGEKQKLRTSVENIVNNGETDMDSALNLAFEDLEGDSSAEKVAILLTDGKDRPGSYEDAHRKFVEKGWRVHAIGLSKKADHVTLRRVAEDTGGQYHDAPSSSELQRVFGAICFSIEKRTLIRREELALNQVKAVSSYEVDRTIRNFTLTADSRNEIKASLVSPEEKPVAEEDVGGKGTFRYFDLWNPMPGKWRLECERWQDAPATSVMTEATAVTPLNLWLFSLKKTYEWGDPVGFWAGLFLVNEPIKDGKVAAHITMPDGSKEIVPLAASADLYQATFTEGGLLGDYGIILRASGKTSDGDVFEREVHAQFEVVQTKAPRLWLSERRFDFGPLYPGEIVSKTFQSKMVTAQKLAAIPMKVGKRLAAAGKDSSFVEDAVQLLPQPTTISSTGLKDLKIRIRVPFEQKPGEYSGRISLAPAVGAEIEHLPEINPVEISFRMNVMQPQIEIIPARIDLGTMQSGESGRVKVKIRYQPRGAMPAQLSLKKGRSEQEFAPRRFLDEGQTVDKKLVASFTAKISLKPGDNEVDILLATGRHTSPGARRWSIRLDAGLQAVEIPLSFSLKWPKLSVMEESLDFGKVSPGEVSQFAVGITHSSLHPESIRILPVDQESAEIVKLDCGPPLTVLSGTEKPSLAVVKISLPENTVPGDYSGKIQVRAWFGIREIPWKVTVEPVGGFVVSSRLLMLTGIQPGSMHRKTLEVKSTIPIRQRISIRALGGPAISGIKIRFSPGRFNLAPDGRQKIIYEMAVADDAKPQTVTASYQLRGPHNSARVALRAVILPKEVKEDIKPPIIQPPAEPPPPPPVFTVSVDNLHFGELRPGESAERMLVLTGNRLQTIRATLTDSKPRATFEFSANTIDVASDHPGELTITCRIKDNAAPGLVEAQLVVSNGEKSAAVPTSVQVIEPETAVVAQKPPPPPKKAMPAPAAPARPSIPPWVHYLLWTLLVLLLLFGLVMSLRWLFVINIPDMTKYYLASGIFHCLLGVGAAFYYLESKMVEIQEPELLRIRLAKTQPKKQPESVRVPVQSMRKVERAPIEVKQTESKTKPEPSARKASSESKSKAAKSSKLQPKNIEMQKKTQEILQQLHAVASTSSKQLSQMRQATVNSPQLRMQIREVKPVEKQKSKPVEVVRKTEDAVEEKKTTDLKVEEKTAKRITPEKPTKEEEVKLAKAETQTQKSKPLETPTTNTKVETPTQKKEANQPEVVKPA